VCGVVPLGWLGAPEDVALATPFLTSAEVHPRSREALVCAHLHASLRSKTGD